MYVHTEMLTDGIVHVVDLRARGRSAEPSRGEPDPGNIVTAPRSDMMVVVTEFGLVNLKGKSIPERAKAMTSLAQPGLPRRS